MAPRNDPDTIAAALAILDDRGAQHLADLASTASTVAATTATLSTLAAGGGRAHDHAAHAEAHDEHAHAVDNRNRAEAADDRSRLAALVLRIAPHVAELRAAGEAIAAEVDRTTSRVLTEAGKSPLRSQLDAIRLAAASCDAIETHTIPTAITLAGLA